MSSLTHYIGLLLAGATVLVLLVAGIAAWRQAHRRRAAMAAARLPAEQGADAPSGRAGGGGGPGPVTPR